MIRFTGFAIGAGLALTLLSAPTAAAQWLFGASPTPLSEIEETLAARHDDIAHATPDELAGLRAAGEAFLLLDVRPRKEFEVSHLPGAIQIDPGASISDVKILLAGTRPGTPIIVYCSVGRRSSRLGSRIADRLDGHEVINLRGGVFAWHNQDRPLENAAGTTSAIHPYNDTWGKLIERSENISYDAPAAF